MYLSYVHSFYYPNQLTKEKKNFQTREVFSFFKLSGLRGLLHSVCHQVLSLNTLN